MVAGQDRRTLLEEILNPSVPLRRLGDSVLRQVPRATCPAGSCWSESRPDGSLYGEGQGVLLLQNGENMTLKGAGAGTIKAGGAVSYRGAVYFSTSSPKLARLNTVAAVFEFEVDASGNTHSKFWEWK